MATGQEIVDWISQFKGRRDDSGAFMWALAGMPYLTGSAWCGGTRVAAEKALGIDLSSFITPTEELFVPDWVDAARDAKIWTPSVKSQVGWPVIFDWQGHQDSASSNADHVGTIVHNDPRLSYVWAIGGNTSDGINANLQRGVFLRRRPRTEIMGTVNISQWLTTKSSHPLKKNLVVDGVIGTNSTEALGAGDGVFSGQPNSIWDKKTRETLQACWPTLQHGTGGSKAIAKMQRTIGVHDDGYFGPNTRKGLQKWLGVKVDGFPGYITCKALQRAHNDGRI